MEQFSDTDFITAMKEMDRNIGNLREAVVYLRDNIISVASLSAAPMQKMLYCSEVSEIVSCAENVCRRPDGRTDVLGAVRLTLMASIRFAQAAVTGLDRLTDASGSADPDDPIVV